MIWAGDISIDIIKYDNAETLEYLTTLLSNRFLPYITLPTRITEYPATCINHMFIKVSNRDRILYENILAGILYCDIKDHLPCVVSLRCINYIDDNDRPKVRLYGEKKSRKIFRKDEFSYVKYHYDQSFPLVKVSRKRMKDKPWVSKGIKISIKQNHWLYRASLRSNNASAVVKYKRYDDVLRRCIKDAEMAYYDRLFQDTKTSSYNLRKHLGAIINPNKKKRICHNNKLLYDGNIITDDKLISDSMNSYFCNIGLFIYFVYCHKTHSDTNRLYQVHKIPYDTGNIRNKSNSNIFINQTPSTTQCQTAGKII